MKIAVIGVGGVGGYLAALLSKYHKDVTVVARGKRGESIKEKGLVLHSDYKGEIISCPKVVSSVKELSHQDYVFICVKNYSLEEVCKDLSGSVDEHTVIIPVMNGVDPGDRVRALLPMVTVIDSLIYTVSFAMEDYSIRQQMGFTNLCIGSFDHGEAVEKSVKAVEDILSSADIDVKIAEDIRLEIWRKYVLNCAYNVATARHKTTIGPLRDSDILSKDYEALVLEAAMVGKALGVAIKEEHTDHIIWRFYHEHAYDAGSSLQRDVCAGRASELETFSGYIVKTAKRLGLSVPVSEAYYQALLEMEGNA